MNAPTQQVAATLAVRVSLNATGDLVAGAVSTVERLEAVAAVSEPTVCGLEPGLNDTTVTLEAQLDVCESSVGEQGEDLAVLRRDLERGFGVSVEALELLEADTATPKPTPVVR